MRLCGIEEGLAGVAGSTWCSFELKEAARDGWGETTRFLKICRNRWESAITGKVKSIQ